MKSLTGLMCLSLCASTLTLAIPVRSPARKDVLMVAPALDKYTQERLLGDVWNRPGLSTRDRSIVTLAALIARDQTIALSDQGEACAR